MAKKHLITLEKDLFEGIGKEVERIEVEVNSITKQEMVDPEVVEELTTMIRSVSTEIQNVAKGISMAYKYEDEFLTGHRSLNTLVKMLKETLTKVVEKEPENPLVEEYKKQIQVHSKTLQLYKDIKEVKDLPKAKKRYKKWVKKGWYIEQPFRPFKDLWESLKEITSYMEENL